MTYPVEYTIHTKVSEHTRFGPQEWKGLAPTDAAVKFVALEMRHPGRHTMTAYGKSGYLSEQEVATLIGEHLIFRLFAPSRPDLHYPTFRGTGNLQEALEYLEEFKEDAPGLASEARIEYQLIPEWTPLI